MPNGPDSVSEREALGSFLPQPKFLPDKFKGRTDRPPTSPTVRDVYPQIISACIAHLLVIQAGINMAYSAILLPQLMAPESSIPVNKEEASWIASLMAISTPVGALVCGPLMDLLGRKLFSIISIVPVALSWAIMVFTPNLVWPLFVARVLAGFGGGLTTVSLVYISEISEASWRPMLLCLNSVFVSLGILLTNVLGVLLPWRVVALCCGVLTVASALAIALYNPESPYWLLNFRSQSDKHFNQAKQSLQFLYPNQQMFAQEWDRLVTSSQEKQRAGEQRGGLSNTVKRMVSEFTKRSALLPIALLMIIFLFQQLSGTYPIIFYAVQVFQSIGGDFGAGINADSATVILGVIRFVISLLTAFLSRKYGRRPLLILSGIGMTISGILAAVYFQQTCVFSNAFNTNQDMGNTSSVVNCTGFVTKGHAVNSSIPLMGEGGSEGLSSLIGLACILIFVMMSSIGILIIPWTLIGEILPLTIRGIGGGFIFSYAYLLMFGIVKVFPFMLDIFNISGMFYFFSFTSFANVVVVYFLLPETLGKSFQEIEKAFLSSSVHT